jgi:hypothetical protein
MQTFRPTIGWVSYGPGGACQRPEAFMVLGHQEKHKVALLSQIKKKVKKKSVRFFSVYEPANRDIGKVSLGVKNQRTLVRNVIFYNDRISPPSRDICSSLSPHI